MIYELVAMDVAVLYLLLFDWYFLSAFGEATWVESLLLWFGLQGAKETEVETGENGVNRPSR